MKSPVRFMARGLAEAIGDENPRHSNRHSGAHEVRTSDVQLHIGESRDSGFDASHRPGMTVFVVLSAARLRRLEAWAAGTRSDHPSRLAEKAPPPRLRRRI